jgi:hypothetical protein
MLSRLRKISRRIGSEIGGLMATGKSAKGSTKGKAASKAAPKAAAKKAAKPAAKAAKPAAKPVAKAALKPAAKAVAAKSGKTDKKAAAAKAPALKAVVKAPKKAEKPAKVGKSPKVAVEIGAVAVEADFAAEEQFAADIASDMEAAETETAVAEPVSPSAALLAVMKPTVSDEKAAEKKKKKDDLKIDRNGDMEAQWQSLKDKNKAIKPFNYKMSESFEARTPILHKVLGWGFIISNQNDRLEVLFQQGIKFLISNYKA